MKVEHKTAVNGETWIRMVKKAMRKVKTTRQILLGNAQAIEYIDHVALIDSGANTALQGADMRIIHQEHGVVSVVGPSGSEDGMTDLALVTCGGVDTTLSNEKVLVILTSAASYGKGKSILSRFQLEHYRCKVFDCPRASGCRQILTILDGYAFKLKFKSELMYLPMDYPSDDEMEKLPRVHLTCDSVQWNPDEYNDDDDTWYDAILDSEEEDLNDDEFFESRDSYAYEHNTLGHVNSTRKLENLHVFANSLLYDTRPQT